MRVSHINSANTQKTPLQGAACVYMNTHFELLQLGTAHLLLLLLLL
jgi:hypothetical protein